MKEALKNAERLKDLHLDLNRTLYSLSLLLLPGLGLHTHNTTTPVSSVLLILAGITLIDRRHKFAQLGLIIPLDFGESKHGGGLLVHDSAQTGLALDDRVGNTHLAAESGEEDDELDGVDVVGDQD